jgi:serine/threonine-protein kinase HipA
MTASATKTELPIHYDGRVVAVIDTAAEETRLRYQPSWLEAQDRFPISLSMPLEDTVYPAELVLPWLMNLLPEGEPLRAMTRVLGAAPEDVLGLIAETGGDLAGALNVVANVPHGPPGHRVIPGVTALERIIDELPRRPFLVDEEGVAMSLAGAQNKLPIAFSEGQIAVPVNGAPSTHILKPDNPHLFESVQNEALCMVLARRIGLDVAEVTTGRAGARNYLLVTRYDRAIAQGAVRRIHQEDFCQALGRQPGAKYEFNRTGRRGPSLGNMFGLVRRHMTALDINRLLDAVIFNIAIGNVDSHAKNYSTLLQHDAVRLAPLYDLMSGLVWDGITQNHAQAIGDQRRGLYIHGRHWRRMAEECGLSARATVRRVGDITTRLLRALPLAVEEVQAMPAGPGAMLGHFSRAIEERASEVGRHALHDGDEAADPALEDAPVSAADATAYHG